MVHHTRAPHEGGHPLEPHEGSDASQPYEPVQAVVDKENENQKNRTRTINIEPPFLIATFLLQDSAGVDPVTETDQENERIVAAGLRRSFPNYDIIGEEASSASKGQEKEGGK